MDFLCCCFGFHCFLLSLMRVWAHLRWTNTSMWVQNEFYALKLVTKLADAHIHRFIIMQRIIWVIKQLFNWLQHCGWHDSMKRFGIFVKCHLALAKLLPPFPSKVQNLNYNFIINGCDTVNLCSLGAEINYLLF